MDPLEENFSEEDVDVSDEHSFESRVFAEIEKTKQKLCNIQPEPNEDIDFYLNSHGILVMVIGETPEHDFSNELERTEFKKGSDVKRLMRKLEDLLYAKEHGEFPDEVPRGEIADLNNLPYL